MYAIIRTGGKQYKVEAGDEILVEKLDLEAGAEVCFVMKMNTELGYVPVTFNELTDDESFWKGCEGCINHEILMAKKRKFCICTAMLYDPALHTDDKVTNF